MPCQVGRDKTLSGDLILDEAGGDIEWRTNDGYVYLTEPIQPILEAVRRARAIGVTHVAFPIPISSRISYDVWDVRVTNDSIILFPGYYGTQTAQGPLMPKPAQVSMDRVRSALNELDTMATLKRHRDDIALHDERMAKKPRVP